MQKKELLFHKSVLVDEVIHYLNPIPDGVYIDVTFGSGGHTRAILEKEPTCTVIAIDWDAESLEKYGSILQEEFGDRFMPVWGNFAYIYKILKKLHIQRVDGILADFGTSQMQIHERAGFSFSRDTPLDMRMSVAHHKTSAQEVVNESPVGALIRLFKEYGEERFASKIAHAIVAERAKTPIKTTRQLASIIEKNVAWQRGRGIHPATRVFQALRIFVNKELENIQAFLSSSIHFLEPGGRIVCISFHSLEDRLVKVFFREQQEVLKLTTLTKKVVEATEQEVTINPSSRSAKLRAAEKL